MEAVEVRSVLLNRAGRMEKGVPETVYEVDVVMRSDCLREVSATARCRCNWTKAYSVGMSAARAGCSSRCKRLVRSARWRAAQSGRAG